MTKALYLDHNATAPLRPEARDAMVEVLAEGGNASAVHQFGRRARARVEQARASVSALVDGGDATLVFTSGGTEANNLALHAWSPDHCLVSAGEHASVLEVLPGCRQIALHPGGDIDLASLEEQLQTIGSDDPNGALVSVMLANNETGVVQPLEAVVGLAKSLGCRVHCDAVQATGKLEFSMKALDIDYLSISAHKIGGPQGVGALLAKKGAPLSPLLRGGGQESRLRSGTENLAGIVGFGAAAEVAARALPDFARLATMRDRLEEELAAIASSALFFGQDNKRLANTSCFAVPGLSGETQVMAMDLAGVAVSAGSACSSGKVEPSHVIRAMGHGDDLAQAALRVSLGWTTVEEDITAFLNRWKQYYQRLQAA